MSPETIERIREMDELLQRIEPVILEIPKMSTLMSTVTTAMQTMSASSASMALSNAQAEERFKRSEEREILRQRELKEANDRASGRHQIPMISHIITVVIIGFIAMAMTLYANQQMIDATLSSIKMGNKQ